MLYDKDELKRSIELGERKLAERRQKTRKQARLVYSVLAILCVLTPIVILALVAARRAPSSPNLVLTWPKPKIAQVIASGQTVLAREGQPFNVSVTQAEKWAIAWRTGDAESNGDVFDWSPSQSGGTLIANCRAQSDDWTSLFSFLWPSREISIAAIKGEQNSNAPGNEQYRRRLVAGDKGAWIYPHVQAVGDIAWDERTLPILADVIPTSTKNELSSQLAKVSTTPTPLLWQIVSDFDGNTQVPATDGTFAAYRAAEVANSLPRIAAQIVKSTPDVSIKFVIRLDKDQPEGIVRLAYDGKRDRKAWVKRKGESAGKPFTGWESGEWKGTLPLEMPTPTP